jgi:DNA-binding NtrC family response regulator
MAFTVLLVDDEEELVSTVVERLSIRGIDAEFVLSGAEAVQKLQEKKYDVLVVDVKMPGMSGLEVMRRMKKEKPNMPVLLMTGHGSVQDGETGIKEGAFAYLAKPVKLEDLIAKMKEAIQHIN